VPRPPAIIRARPCPAHAAVTVWEEEPGLGNPPGIAQPGGYRPPTEVDDHHMAGSDTGSALITGGAAVVGALVGGGISWLANWTTTRRSSEEARDERRRTAYVAFLAGAEELNRLVTTAQPGIFTLSGSGLDFREELTATLGPIDRAYVAVSLVGPKTADQTAEKVRSQAWVTVDLLRKSKLGDPVGRQLGEIESYQGLCDEFADLARKILDS
jgi:hypothetical protein